MGYRLAVVVALAGCRFSSGQASSDGAVPIDSPPPPIDAVDAAHDTIPGDWWDTSFTHRRLVTIDGTKLTGNVSGFPILVTLDPTTIDYAAVATGGADIRFIAADNTTVLDYELDTFQSGGTSLAWV